MTLTAGGARKDVIDSTFYFVKYDGRWAIADMIATTKWFIPRRSEAEY